MFLYAERIVIRVRHKILNGFEGEVRFIVVKIHDIIRVPTYLRQNEAKSVPHMWCPQICIMAAVMDK